MVISAEFARIWHEAEEATIAFQQAIRHVPEGGHISDLPEYADWKKKSAAFTEACDMLVAART